MQIVYLCFLSTCAPPRRADGPPAPLFRVLLRRRGPCDAEPMTTRTRSLVENHGFRRLPLHTEAPVEITDSDVFPPRGPYGHMEPTTYNYT